MSADRERRRLAGIAASLINGDGGVPAEQVICGLIEDLQMLGAVEATTDELLASAKAWNDESARSAGASPTIDQIVRETRRQRMTKETWEQRVRNERREARRRFMQRLDAFEDAARLLSEEWGAMHPEDKDWPNDGYPFGESFDETVSRIAEWNDRVMKGQPS